MPNAAAIIGLTYRTTDLQEDPWGLFLEIKKGLNTPPAVRGTDTLVPSRAFNIARNRIKAGRMVLLEGFLYGEGADEAAQRTDVRLRILELFTGDTPVFDVTVTGELVATLEDGRTATILARTVNVLDDVIGPSAYRLSIELEANVDDWVYEGVGS